MFRKMGCFPYFLNKLPTADKCVTIDCHRLHFILNQKNQGRGRRIWKNQKFILQHLRQA